MTTETTHTTADAEIDELERRRRALALDVAEGRATEEELDLVEQRLLALRRLSERAVLAEQARAERERAEEAARRDAEHAAIEEQLRGALDEVKDLRNKFNESLPPAVENAGRLYEAGIRAYDLQMKLGRRPDPGLIFGEELSNVVNSAFGLHVTSNGKQPLRRWFTIPREHSQRSGELG